MARFLILRAEEEARQSAAALAELGHEAIVAPIVTWRPTRQAIVLGAARALIATSARALRSLYQDDAARLASLPLFAVGEATARAARTAGFQNVIIGGGHAEALIDSIRRLHSPSEPLLYLAGEPRRPAVETALVAAGFKLAVQVVYRMQQADILPEEARRILADGTVNAVLHYSAETAALFVRLTQAAGLAVEAGRLTHFALSDAVGQEMASLSAAQVCIAELPTETALFALIRGLRG